MLRFAPLPVGDMHSDDLRVAILSYLVAQQKQERFMVCIDDTDKEKVIEGKDTEMMQILEKFALTHDTVLHQSEKLHLYQTLAIGLLEKNKAFVCTCGDEALKNKHYSGRCFETDKEELSKLKDSSTAFVVRIKKPDAPVVFHDDIRGEIEIAPDIIDSFVILNADGTSTPDFASACADMLMGVTMILSTGADIIHTAKQKHIKMQLGYEEETEYAHLPALVGDDENLTVKWLFEQGFIPDAIINYLLLLGYTDAPTEVFTLPEAMTWFKLENLSKDVVMFDVEKLRLLNKKHLEKMGDRDLSTLFGFADAAIGKLAKLYLEEVSTLKELEAKIYPIFAPKNFGCEWGVQMRTLEEIIQNAPMIANFEAFECYMMKESGFEADDFLTPLSLLLTGREFDSKLPVVYPFIKPYLLEIAS
jgi:glutamyl-tRNA synthetase